MLDCKITVVKVICHEDLKKLYENHIENACFMKEGDVFLSKNGQMPFGFCAEAWKSVQPVLIELASGKVGLYDNWMKNERTAVVSCNDGIRPVSFLVEAIV